MAIHPSALGLPSLGVEAPIPATRISVYLPPETKGKTFDQIQAEMGGQKKYVSVQEQPYKWLPAPAAVFFFVEVGFCTAPLGPRLPPPPSGGCMPPTAVVPVGHPTCGQPVTAQPLC
eukprot:COSAG02_NODE_207_length_29119_cov_41.071365_24_plen_117_part_00